MLRSVPLAGRTPACTPPMRRPLRLPLLALICLAAVLLAACGSSSSGSGQDTEKLVNDTFGNTKPVTSGRMKLGIDVRADGLAGVPSPLTVRLGGPFQRTTSGGAPKFAFDISLATRDGQFTVGIISTGRQGWVKLGQRAFTLPPAQLKQLAGGGGTGSKGGLPGDLGALGVDPRLWISNVQDEGVETLEGTKVVHLSADVDIPGLVKDLDKLLSSAGGTGLNAIAGLPTGVGKDNGAVAKAVKSAGVDIWTGEKDHQLRRITIKLVVDTPSQKNGTVSLDLGIAGLNEDQPIGPPANPRPLSELSAALAVLGRAQSQAGSASGTPGSGGSGSSVAPAQGYDACVQAAGSDLTKAQACADLLD
jgi:predicted small secreted protein